MHRPSTRLCSRWYSSGAAGLARLTDSAILSALPVRGERDDAAEHEGDEREDEAVADERPDRGADEHDDQP